MNEVRPTGQREVATRMLYAGVAVQSAAAITSGVLAMPVSSITSSETVGVAEPHRRDRRSIRRRCHHERAVTNPSPGDWYRSAGQVDLLDDPAVKIERPAWTPLSTTAIAARAPADQNCDRRHVRPRL